MDGRASVFVLYGLGLLFLLFTWSAPPVSASTDEVSIVWLDDLDFGKLIVLASGAVRVAPSVSCQRVVEVGDVVNMGHCSAARFRVKGEANRSYVVSLPTPSIQMPPFGDWWLGGYGPLATNFTSASTNNYVLSTDGMDTLLVGGTLHINAGLPYEQYFGVLDVVVEYE